MYLETVLLKLQYAYKLPGHFAKRKILSQWVQGGAWGFAFPTSSGVMLTLPVCT